MARKRFPMAWIFVGGFFLAAGLCGAEKPVRQLANQSHDATTDAIPVGVWDEIDESVAKALAGETRLDFSKAPLQEVVEYLKKTHKIEIRLDKRWLNDMGVTGATPVTIHVKGISLKSALSLMCRNMQPELTYEIRNKDILITTVDLIDGDPPSKLYPVADLVSCLDEHNQPWDDYDSLIDLITSTIRPDSWGRGGMPGAITGNTFGTAKVLIVAQTPEIHEEIAELLAKIREIAKRSPNADPPRRNRPTRPGHGNILKEKPPVMPGGGMF